jgi:FemAB-related protein (PEP-CTERM system-associated)
VSPTARATGPENQSPAASDTLVVRAGSPADDAARDAFCRAHPRGTFFHLSGWRRAVEREFGHEPADLLAFRGDVLAGCLPLMLCRGPLGRGDLISMPYAVYGGALGADHAVEAALVAAAKARALELGVGRLELRFFEDPGLGLLPLELYATFIQELPAEAALVLPGMPKKARAEARHARERHGLELVEGRWYLDDLSRLFQQNKQSLGSPGLPLRWFRGLAQEFGRDVVVHLVHRERQPLAAVLSFVWHDTLLAYYAGTVPGADRAFSASNFMYMALREWAVGAGFKRFDFGRSRRDSGAFDFKRRQGFEPLPLAYGCHLVRKKELPSFNPSNPRTKVLRDIWSRLPPWLATRLSERLSRYLP